MSFVKTANEVGIYYSPDQGTFQQILDLGYVYDVFADGDGNKWKDQINWCEENEIQTLITSIYFHFLCEEDAMAFKLAWI